MKQLREELNKTIFNHKLKLYTQLHRRGYNYEKSSRKLLGEEHISGLKSQIARHHQIKLRPDDWVVEMHPLF